MKRFHVPEVNARYWAAITFASVFGTNLGDLYAHETGLGIVAGIAILAALAAIVFLVERGDDVPRELWYRLAIIIIRTGATNIADFLAFRVRVEPVALAVGLGLLLGWRTRRSRLLGGEGAAPSIPDAGGVYWAAMLTAGVLGTVLGDDLSHAIGEGPASITLLVLLGLSLLVTRGSSAIMAYWAVVGTARTAGTAIGDFIAETRELHIGLPLSTLITGIAFVLALLVWRQPPVASAGTPEVRHVAN